MFTVKHRSADGIETIHAAKAIEVVQSGDMFEDGIFLDREPTPISEEGQHRFAAHIIQFGGNETEDRKNRRGGMVWVMNESGATVATYRL